MLPTTRSCGDICGLDYFFPLVPVELETLAAPNDPYFKEEPYPAADVFGEAKSIPYIIMRIQQVRKLHLDPDSG